MTWPAQVWHVLRKDLVENWPLGLLVFGIAAALASATLSRLDPNDLPLVMATLAFPIILVVYMTRAVSADQPARSDVFWATQPLRPDAVAAAKLARILGVVAILTSVSTVVCIMSDATTSAVLSLVGVRMINVLGLGLVGAHVATCLNDRDSSSKRRAWLSVAVILVGVVVLIYNRNAALPQQIVNAIPVSVISLAYLGCIALFIQAYRQRERAQVTGVATVACCVLIVAGVFRNSSLSGALMPRDTGTSAVSFTPAFDGNGRLELAISYADDEAGTLQGLSDAVLTAVLRDGSRVRLPMGRERLWHTYDRALRFVTAGAADTVTAPHPRRSETYIPTGVWSPPDQLSSKNVVRLILDGVIETHLLHEFVRYPAKSGRWSRADGTEISISTDLYTSDSAGPYAELRKYQLPLARGASVWPLMRVSNGLGVYFALSDSTSHALLPMWPVNWAVDGGPPNIMGFGRHHEMWMLRPQRWSSTTPPVDSTWLANAYLIAAAPRLQRSQRFHAEVAVP
jgi:FtsH-binding integral membrane protein